MCVQFLLHVYVFTDLYKISYGAFEYKLLENNFEIFINKYPVDYDEAAYCANLYKLSWLKL